jgi:hypothetical protein
MGADDRRSASGGATRCSRKIERRWGKTCSPHEEELAGVLGDGEAAVREIVADGPRWTTTAAVLEWDKRDPVNQNRCTNKLRA